MKKAMLACALLLFSRTLLSFLFTALSGVFREIGGILSYLLPMLLFLSPLYKRLPKEAGLGFSAKRAHEFLPLFPFFLAGVIIISVVTTYVAMLVGYEISAVSPSDKLPLALLFDVLTPAIFEELLCRYALLRLLAPYGKGGAAMLSALLFSLMHANIYQMPYAFFAGLVLSTLALASESVLVPVLFHILNNLVSVILFRLPDTAALYFYGAIIILLPLAFFLAVKKGSFNLCGEVLSDGTVSKILLASLYSPLILYALLMLSLTV